MITHNLIPSSGIEVRRSQVSQGVNDFVAGHQDQTQTEYLPVQRKHQTYFGWSWRFIWTQNFDRIREVGTHFDQPLRPTQVNTCFNTYRFLYVLPKLEEKIENLLKEIYIVKLGKYTAEDFFLLTGRKNQIGPELEIDQ